MNDQRLLKDVSTELAKAQAQLEAPGRLSASDRRNDWHLLHSLFPSKAPDCPVPQDTVPASVRESRTMWQDRGAPRSTVSCSKCVGRAPGCCYNAVSLTLLEAVELVESHPKLIRERRVAIEALAAREDSVMGPMFDFLGTLGDLGSAEERDILLHTVRTYEREATRRWFAEQAPCAFLTRRGQCAVYHARPIGCALYAVVSPPAACDPSDLRDVAKVDVRGLHAQWLAECLERSIARDIPPVVFIGVARAVRAAIEWAKPR